MDADLLPPCHRETLDRSEAALEAAVHFELAGVMDRDDAETREPASVRLDQARELVDARERCVGGNELRRVLVEHPLRVSVDEASDDAANWVGRRGSHAASPKRLRAAPDAVEVMRPAQ